MTHIITSLCLRDGACMEVCPVECIVPGKPEEEWPWYFIDPDTCIDCGACVPEFFFDFNFGGAHANARKILFLEMLSELLGIYRFHHLN